MGRFGRAGERCIRLLHALVSSAFCSFPATFLWMGYTGTQFQVYDACMRWGSGDGAAKSLACGSMAGFAATVATYPLDIVRTVCAQHEAGAAAAARYILSHVHPPVYSASHVDLPCPALSCVAGTACTQQRTLMSSSP